MPEIKLGTVILFLIPGLLAYCALFGIFVSRSQLTVAPAPPAANSIKTIAIILLASIVAHGMTAILIAANGWFCASGGCPLVLEEDFDDLYRLIARLARSAEAGSMEFAYVISAAFVQGFAAYAIIRIWLKRCASRDALPDWLYGWSAQIANKVDDEDRVLLAYVLTTIDIRDRTVVYAGAVRDIALLPDGGIGRITLLECERYLVDLTTFWTELDAEPLAVFEIMTLESGSVRNIAFETISAAAVEDQAADSDSA